MGAMRTLKAEKHFFNNVYMTIVYSSITVKLNATNLSIDLSSTIRSTLLFCLFVSKAPACVTQT